jgi:hypothetical protein
MVDEDHLRAYRVLSLLVAMKILRESEPTSAALQVSISVVSEDKYLPGSTDFGLGLCVR